MSPFLESRGADGTAVDQTSPAHELYVVPLAGTIISIILAILSLSVLSAFFSQRFLAVTSWRKLPPVGWLIFAIYVDSWLFVAIATILRYGPGINTSWELCSTSIFLCLSFYLTTKLIYLFLVEKAFIVWGTGKSRLQSKLYLFNAFGMLSIFVVIGVFNFIYRITDLTDGKCVIGMQRPVLIPLVSFDLAVNVYLTVLFLIPLRELHAFTMEQTSGNAKLRTLVRRTFIGAVTSTISCMLNIIIMMALDGEPGWVCLMSCNIDLFFDAIIVHYVTSRDNAGTQTTDYDKGRTVAVERSIAIHHTTNWTKPRRNRSDKKSHEMEEEEMDMATMGAPPAGSHLSFEILKADMEDDISFGSLDNLELGNRTRVVARGKDFN